MNKNKKVILIIFGYLVSLSLLVIVFKDTNFERVFEYLKKIDPFLVLLALLLNVIFVWIRGAYQKNNLYITTPNIRTGTSIVSIGISLFYNAILPTRLGDVIRAVFISLRDNIKKKRLLPYILVEKIIDFLFVIFFFFLIVIIESEDEILSYLFVTLAVIIISIITFILYVKFNKKVINFVLSIVPAKFNKLFSEINHEAINGMSCFKTKNQIAKSLVLLISGWVIILCIFYILSYPFIDQLNLPNYSAIYFLFFSAVALSLPSAPSGIGTVHYGLYLAVQILMGGDVSNDQSDLVAALIISLHFLLVVLDVIVGGVILLLATMNILEGLKIFLHQELEKIWEMGGKQEEFEEKILTGLFLSALRQVKLAKFKLILITLREIIQINVLCKLLI